MTISVVQTKVISGALSGTLSAATTEGNTLYIAFVANGTGSTPSISGATLGGSADNFASQYAVTDIADSFAICAIWMDADLQQASTAVAVTGTNLNDGYLYCVEVAGMGPTPTLDKTSEGPIGAGTTTWTSNATGTLSTAAEFAIGCTGHGRFSTGDTLTGPGSPWVNGADYVWADGSAIAGYQITTTTAAVTYSGTSVDNDYYVAIVATFIPSAGSSGAAALSGSGSLSAAITLPGVTALSGSGSLAASAHFAPTATISGSGTLLAGINPEGFANLAGSGTITETIHLGGYTAALNGTGTITPMVYLYSALSGTGSLSATIYSAGHAALTGSGTITEAVKFNYQATLSGSGTISPTPAVGGTFVAYVLNVSETAWETQNFAQISGSSWVATVNTFRIYQGNSWV